MNYKVIGTDQREYGPIAPEQVRQWIQERRLHALSLAQAEGSLEWKPLSMLLDFQGALAGATPPPMPAPLPSVPYAAYRPTNGMAVLSLIMGILAVMVCGCCHGLPFSVLGVVFGLIALSQINRNPQLEGGRGMAIAGLALSILASIWALGLAALALLVAVLGHFAQVFHF